jgi:hypothetical protein
MSSEIKVLPSGWNQEQFVKSITDLKVMDQKSRGGDTMFRIVYSNHLTLSRMADHKAHFMMGVNTFLLSFVVTKKKMGVLTHQAGMLVPEIMLVVMCIICIILATLVTKPSLPPKRKTKLAEIDKVNWLFFGDYAQYSLEEFNRGLNWLISHPNALNEAMTKDLYWLGVSLARKYRYLSLCYSVFYIGLLVLSAIFLAFAWSFRG